MVVAAPRTRSLSQGLVEHGIAAGWSLLLAMALSWPASLSPGQAALGNVHADGMKHLWTLWWMRASAWEEGRLPFHTKLINYPTGMDLYPIEPLNGLFAVVLPFVPVVMLSNLLVLLNLVATGLAGAWLGRLLSGSRLGGLAAGTLLMGSSVMAFFVHVGVGELLHLWWLPLGLGCLVKGRETLRWGWFLGLAGCLVGAMLSGFYLGFFLALSVLIAALSTLRAGRDSGRLLLRYAVAAVLSVAVVWPVTRSFAASYRSGDVPPVGVMDYVLKDHGQPVTDPVSARLDPVELLKPGREPITREDDAYGGGRYLGLLVLGLALFGLVREPRKGLPFLLVATVGMVFALGTYLVVNGEEVMIGGGRLRLPLLWLNRLLGYLAEPLNFPIRFLAMTVAGLSALGALGFRRVTYKRQLLLLGLSVLAVIEVQADAQTPWPWDRFQPRNASGLEVLRQEEGGAVIDLALIVRADHENRWSALSTQISHGKATQAVPIERVEFFARDGLLFTSALPFVQDLQPLYENDYTASLSRDYSTDFAILQDAGFRWVLVTYRTGREQIPQVLADELTRVLGPPVASGPGVAAWRLPEVEVTEEQMHELRQIHADLMAQRKAEMRGAFGRPLR